MNGRLQVTEKLSAYIAEKERELPAPIAQRAKIHILDTLGAIISGSTLKAGRLGADFVRLQGGVPEATVAACDFKTTAVLASLANAMMAHADETDDTHYAMVLHPGSVVVPAALAVAERQHASGKELLSAVVLGYDIMCRVARALDKDGMQARCVHAGSVCANFGAAAAAGSLLHLKQEQVRFALAFAATQASGLTTWRQDLEHIEKALCFSGIPVRNGVTAALWAQAGFTAARDVFEGQENFLRAFGRQAATEELVRELGTRYEILATGLKKYPAGQPMQQTLEAYFRLVEKHSLISRDIRQICVRLPESQAHTINDRHMPDVNCQYLLAVAMQDGRVDFASAHAFDRMRDPEILALKKRVRIVADPELTEKHPAVRAAIVEITMTGGREYRLLVDSIPGAPSHPLSEEEAAHKFLSLSMPLLGERPARAIVGLVGGLDELSHVGALTAQLAVK